SCGEPTMKRRKQRDADPSSRPISSFYNFAKMGSISIAAMKKLGEYSVQDDIHGAELCDLFNRLTVYYRRMKVAEQFQSERESNQDDMYERTTASSTAYTSKIISTTPSEVVTVDDEENHPETSSKRYDYEAEQASIVTVSFDPVETDTFELPITPPIEQNTVETESYNSQFSPLSSSHRVEHERRPHSRNDRSMSMSPHSSHSRSPSPHRHSTRTVHNKSASSHSEFLDSCAFCSSTRHESMHCDVYRTCNRRHDRKRELGLCLYCLLRYDPVYCSSQEHRVPCKICGKHKT
ncbi:hypothetical protein PFISCL1PPCAC_11132, partial [Pristionchus fissidentatus]